MRTCKAEEPMGVAIWEVEEQDATDHAQEDVLVSAHVNGAGARGQVFNLNADSESTRTINISYFYACLTSVDCSTPQAHPCHRPEVGALPSKPAAQTHQRSEGTTPSLSAISPVSMSKAERPPKPPNPGIFANKSHAAASENNHNNQQSRITNPFKQN